MRGNDLVAYAMDFCSFLLKSGVGGEIEKIILFGSVPRGDFDEESDVDIFIEADERLEDRIEKLLETFERSEVCEKWRLKGVRNPISIKVGSLKAWDIYESIVSTGIQLYGKYQEMPEKAKHYLMFTLDFSGLKRSLKVKAWRKLYGYKQKVGSRLFVSKGLLEKIGGRKVEKSVILVPIENKATVLDLIKEYKIKYRAEEVWTRIP
jgi:predicted nucleotidyltransferase